MADAGGARHHRSLPSALWDLRRVSSPSLGIVASDGALFAGALFGRDALESAEDLLPFRPALAARVLFSLAQRQGLADAPPGPGSSEEERGKIHHEARSLTIDGRPVPPALARMIADLSSKWGGTADGFVYYGSLDATPLFVRLAGRYCQLYGTGILATPVVGRDGRTRTLGDCVVAATEWIERSLASSRTGCLEFHRRNPLGLRNQAWTDSMTGIVLPDGTLANHGGPIAPVEVQGVAYDALLAAAELTEGTDPARAHRWRRAAVRLQYALLNGFWDGKTRAFARALDRDPTTKEVRRIMTKSSSQLTLLDTRVFDDLPSTLRHRAVGALVADACGARFLTDVGIRCRAVGATRMRGLDDYHGSSAVWPKETYDIAKGLRRQGFPRLADELERRILNGVNVFGANTEFFYVDGRGRAATALVPSTARRAIRGTNIPDAAQAWTVAAVYAIKRRIGSRAVEPDGGPWQAALTDRLLPSMGRIPFLRTREAVLELRGRRVRGVNVERGRKKEARVSSQRSRADASL